MGTHWPLEMIVERALLGLREAEDALVLEQAVRGIEAHHEVLLHALIAAGLGSSTGEGEPGQWGVLREVPYPTPPTRRARRVERARCDVVLTPEPSQRILDAVAAALERDALAGTLFAGRVDCGDVGVGGETRAISPQEAMWIEIKTLGQFAYRDGVPMPNRTYSSEIQNGLLGDVTKLGSDASIAHATVLGVIFAASEEIVRHDVTLSVHGMLDRGAPVSGVHFAHFPIADRIGNRACVVVGLGVVCAGA